MYEFSLPSWLIIHDRWEKERFRKRSVEDLKERFYDLWNVLIKVHPPLHSRAQED